MQDDREDTRTQIYLRVDVDLADAFIAKADEIGLRHTDLLRLYMKQTVDGVLAVRSLIQTPTNQSLEDMLK